MYAGHGTGPVLLLADVRGARNRAVYNFSFSLVPCAGLAFKILFRINFADLYFISYFDLQFVTFCTFCTL